MSLQQESSGIIQPMKILPKILVVGYAGKLHYISYALDNKIPIYLLVSRDKYKEDYENVFTSVFVVDNIYDLNQIREAIGNTQITAILTRFEKYISVVGALNEKLQLSGINYAIARNFSNKFLMKSRWLEADVPCADGICVESQKTLDLFLEKHNFPLILKKTSGVHSSFVYKVRSREDLLEKIHLFSTLGKTYAVARPVFGMASVEKECDLLIEEMLSGIEITVDTFVSNGTFIHTPVCQYVMPEELGVHDSYLPIRSIPTDLPKPVRKRVFRIVESALAALGANNCVCHTELFYDAQKDKCWVIESTPRGGGNRSPMVNHATGGDYDASVFRASLGLEIDPFVLNGETLAVIEYFSEKEGVVESLDLDFLKLTPGVKVIINRFKVGDQVKQAYLGGLSMVSVSLEGAEVNENRQEAMELFQKIRASIVVR